MQIPVLIIGNGYDGPVDTAVAPATIHDAYEMFGGYEYINVSLLATDTTFTLPTAGARELQFFTWKDGLLTQFTDVSGVAVSGSTVTLERIGRDIDLVVKYLRPTTPEATEVYKTYAEIKSTVPDVGVYVYRVGGETAAVTIGGASSITLAAPYPGTLYNSASIIVGSDSIVVCPPAGKGEPRTYATEGKSVVEIAQAINLDNLKGYSVFTASCTGTGPLTSGVGTYYFSGGTDVALTDEVVEAALQTIDLQGVKVVTLPARRFKSEPGGSDTIRNYITDEFLQDMTYPTVFVQGVVYSALDANLTPTAYAENIVAAAELGSPAIFKVVGEVEYSYGLEEPYWGSLAPVFAGVLARSNTNCVYQPALISNIRPEFSETSLNNLRSAGYVAFTRSLTKGCVVYSDSASDPEWDTSRYLVYLALAEAVFPVIDGVIGSKASDQAGLQQRLAAVIEEIPSISTYDITVRIPHPSVVEVNITAQPYGTVQSVQFGVVINANFTGV